MSVCLGLVSIIPIRGLVYSVWFLISNSVIIICLKGSTVFPLQESNPIAIQPSRWGKPNAKSLLHCSVTFVILSAKIGYSDLYLEVRKRALYILCNADFS